MPQVAERIAQITSDNVGKPFAIVLDGKIIEAPVIREPITGGSGQISGNFTAQSATDLALLLRAGALPAPLNIVEEQSVGPELGADAMLYATQHLAAFQSEIGRWAMVAAGAVVVHDVPDFAFRVA